MHRRLFQAFGLVVATTAAAGCILFVNDDPSNLHTTCVFQGSDSACAKCVAASCASQLAGCCGDSVCTQVALPLLSTCAPGSSACAFALASEPSLASCVTSACTATCGGANVNNNGFDDAGTPPASDAGSTDCTTSGDSCSCSLGNPNGATCNVNTLKGPGLCCADYGWPNATGSSCSCEPFSCTPEGSGTMFCGLSIDSSLTTSASGNCCAYTTFCTCSATNDCSTGAVSACDVTTIGCDSSQVEVSSCSF